MGDEQNVAYGGNKNGTKGRHTNRCECIARISLDPWAHGTTYSRGNAGVRGGKFKEIGVVGELYTHTWVNIVGISDTPVSTHSNIQKVS